MSLRVNDSCSKKSKQVNLSEAQKLELIKQLEPRMSEAQVSAEHGMSQLKQNTKVAEDKDLEDTVYKRHGQQHLCDIDVS